MKRRSENYEHTVKHQELSQYLITMRFPAYEKEVRDFYQDM